MPVSQILVVCRIGRQLDTGTFRLYASRVILDMVNSAHTDASNEAERLD